MNRLGRKIDEVEAGNKMQWPIYKSKVQFNALLIFHSTVRQASGGPSFIQISFSVSEFSLVIFMVLMLGIWQAAWLGVTRGSPNGRPQLFQHI